MESSVPSGKSLELKQVVQVDNPALWTLEKPNLYHAQVELFVNNKIEDEINEAFGIRTIHFDAGAFFWGKVSWEMRAPHMELLDVVGYNYGHLKYVNDHKKYPERVIYTTEFNPPLSLENWQKVEELPYVIGNFSWTAMDYIGEAGKIVMTAKAAGLKEALIEIVTRN